MKNKRPNFDTEIQDIADYVLNYEINSNLAYETAYYCFLDSLACGLMALNYSACTKLLGPIVPGAFLKNGARVPGTDYLLEPVQAAFNIGTMIRWLDFNDTWLAAEWGHPSDNLGGILAVADYLSRNGKEIILRDVFTALIKAYEIQGILALENSYNRVGLDHVLLVKVATSAVVTHLLGGNRAQILNAVSQAWIDGQSLRTYRHAPNTGSRKSWAAGDATSRGVRLALISITGEMGYPSALTAEKWGFYDILFKGNSFQFQRSYGNYVMENILFKISFPAEFHAQTAVECALKLHEKVKNCLDEIDCIKVETQEAGMRIINKTGPLYNPADRDHCLQYMIAIALLFGELTAQHYEDKIAKDPRIDYLREKMLVTENPTFTKDYLNPNKRSIANSLEIIFKNGSSTKQLTIEYPIGHPRRRQEGIPHLFAKFSKALSSHFAPKQTQKIQNLITNRNKFETVGVNTLLDALICKP